MQLPQKRKILSKFFLHFLNSDSILNIFKKRLPSLLIYFLIDGIRKTWLDKYLTSPDAEDPSTSNMVNGLKYCSKLNESTFTIFIDPCEDN